jgi:putative membrane protein
MMWHGAWGFWPAGGLLGLLVVVLLVAGIVSMVAFLTRSSRRAPPPPTPPADSALQILRERFARGEIDQAEFEERRRALGG